MIGIYKIVSPNDRIYIGQSINIDQRFKTYQNLKQSLKQRKLYRSFLKYGIINHTFEIIEECEESQLNNRERYYQDFYNVLSRKGLNCKLTETFDKSGKQSKETSLRISEAMKGRTLSETHKLALKTKGRNKGKIRSDEMKAKISIKNSGNNNPSAKKVICTETNKIWGTVRECAIENNINYTYLVGKLKGHIKNNTTLKYII